MITSIFNKSKSINFIIVFLVTILAFLTARIGTVNYPMTPAYIFKQLAIFSICVLTIVVFNFIITKNNLSKKNNYEVLLFSLFLLTLVETTLSTDILLSNFFVLLGLRRIVSLKSQQNVKNKLFDAALWITVASLFYFWAILFLIVIVLSLILYTDNNLRHWLIPFFGIATVVVIAVCASIIMYNDYFTIFKGTAVLSYDFSTYNSTRYLVAITTLLSFGIWSSIFYLQEIKKKKKAFRASFKIVLFAAAIAFIIILIAPVKKGSEFLFLFAPLAIIITNYIEIIPDKWFKEAFLWALVIIPFVLLSL